MKSFSLKALKLRRKKKRLGEGIFSRSLISKQAVTFDELIWNLTCRQAKQKNTSRDDKPFSSAFLSLPAFFFTAFLSYIHGKIIINYLLNSDLSCARHPARYSTFIFSSVSQQPRQIGTTLVGFDLLNCCFLPPSTLVNPQEMVVLMGERNKAFQNLNNIHCREGREGGEGEGKAEILVSMHGGRESRKGHRVGNSSWFRTLNYLSFLWTWTGLLSFGFLAKPCLGSLLSQTLYFIQ